MYRNVKLLPVFHIEKMSRAQGKTNNCIVNGKAVEFIRISTDNVVSYGSN